MDNSIATKQQNAQLDQKYALVQTQLLQLGSIELISKWVTPEAAKIYLSLNVGNRFLNKRAVARYTEDMKMDAWAVKPVAICFDEDGNLGNGQHTLHAIIKSGKPQLCLIAYNVPRKSIAMMDVGQKRTISDIATFVGIDFNSPRASVVKILINATPSTTQAPSFQQLCDNHDLYKDAIDFVFQVTNNAKTTGINAITKAVAAMAWYTKDKNRIAEFLECVRTGDATSKQDSAAIRLREVFLKTTGGGHAVRWEQFNKTKSALDLFLKKTSASRLYGTEKNIFPYPTPITSSSLF